MRAWGRLDADARRLLLVRAPGWTQAQAAADGHATREAIRLGGVPYLLAVADLAELPPLPDGWSLEIEMALTTLDPAAIAAELGTLAVAVGVVLARRGLA